MYPLPAGGCVPRAGRAGGLVSVGRRILGIIERMEATDETGSLLSAFTGNYVLPGPSGIITRGREDILPTGRNFYALDPRRLPTRAAWRVGQNLARALIAKHLRKRGATPRTSPCSGCATT